MILVIIISRFCTSHLHSHKRTNSEQRHKTISRFFSYTNPIQKRDELVIVTSNDCDWSILNRHVKFVWPTIRRAKRAFTRLVVMFKPSAEHLLDHLIHFNLTSKIQTHSARTILFLGLWQLFFTMV